MEEQSELVATDLVVDVSVGEAGLVSGWPVLRDQTDAQICDSQTTVEDNHRVVKPASDRLPDGSWGCSEMVGSWADDIPDNMHNCLALNRRYQHKIQQCVELLTDRLNTVRQQLTSAPYGADVTANVVSTDKLAEKGARSLMAGPTVRSTVTWSVFLMRYFSTVDGGCPPYHEDSVKKLHNGEYADMRWSRPWCQSERDCLRRAVIASARQARRDRLRQELQMLDEKSEKRPAVANKAAVQHKDNQLERRRCELSRQLAAVSQLSELELAGDRMLQTHDWLTVAGADGLDNNRSPEECERQWRNLVHPSIEQGEWSEHEDELIRKWLGIGSDSAWRISESTPGAGVWPCLHRELHGRRTPLQLFQRWLMSGQLQPRMWSSGENRRLLDTVQRIRVGNSVNWTEVAFFMDNRSPDQCRGHYFVLNPGLNHGRFSRAEDQAIIAGIEVFQLDEGFTAISRVLGDRNPAQLRRRYVDRLRADRNLRGWKRQEEERLVQLVWQLGNSWTEIATQLGTCRAPTDCRGRFVRIFRQFRLNGTVSLSPANSADAALDNAGSPADSPLQINGTGGRLARLRSEAITDAGKLLAHHCGRKNNTKNSDSVQKRLALFKLYCQRIRAGPRNSVAGKGAVSSRTVKCSGKSNRVNGVLVGVVAQLGRLMAARSPSIRCRFHRLVDDSTTSHTSALCRAWGVDVKHWVSRAVDVAACNGMFDDTDRDIYRELREQFSNACGSTYAGDILANDADETKKTVCVADWRCYPLIPPSRTNLAVLRALLYLRWQLECAVLIKNTNLATVSTLPSKLASRRLNQTLAFRAKQAVANISSGRHPVGVTDNLHSATDVLRHRDNMVEVTVRFRSELRSTGWSGELRSMSLLFPRCDFDEPRRLLQALCRRVPGLTSITVSHFPNAESTKNDPVDRTGVSQHDQNRSAESEDPALLAWNRLVARFVSLMLWPALTSFDRSSVGLPESPLDVTVDDRLGGASLYSTLMCHSVCEIMRVSNKRDGDAMMGVIDQIKRKSVKRPRRL